MGARSFKVKSQSDRSRNHELYRSWLSQRGLVMRHEHFAGDKSFVDYAGKKPHFVDPTTGEVIEVELVVGVLGASNYMFAKATRTQRGPDFIQSHPARTKA